MKVKDITQNLYHKCEIRVLYDNEIFFSTIDRLPTYLLERELKDSDYRWNPMLHRWEFEL